MLRALGLALAVTAALSALTGLFLAPAIWADLAGASDSTVLSLALLAVPAGLVFLWLYIPMNLAGATLALERQGLRATVTRALRLSRGSWWRLFAQTLLVNLVVDLVGLLISPPPSQTSHSTATARQLSDSSSQPRWAWSVRP
ncbi:hypothetical protein GXW82_27420 [Streptacidiphilus sp. 4-A2]|nr:hypothetical protein [Streptacidiphilus sp. 4-A2]